MNSTQGRKVIGRVTYNMAIYEEVNGNLDKALKYAKKAFGDYKYQIEQEVMLSS